MQNAKQAMQNAKSAPSAKEETEALNTNMYRPISRIGERAKFRGNK
jgi:hypothetical protein